MKYLAFALALAVLAAGCTGQSFGVDSLLKSTPAVKGFLAEYPNAKLTTNLLDNKTVEAQIDKIRNDCDNDAFPVGSYYKTVLTDPDSNTKLTLWTDSSTFEVVCAVRESLGGIKSTVPTTIALLKPDGSSCSSSSECKSNYCLNSVCNTPGAITANTTTTKASTTTTLKPFGSPCNNDYECKSGQCINNICNATIDTDCSGSNCPACSTSSACIRAGCVWNIYTSVCVANTTTTTATTTTISNVTTTTTANTTTTSTTTTPIPSKIDLSVSILSAVKGQLNPDPYTLNKINVSVAILNNGTEEAKNVYTYITLYYRNTTFITGGCPIDRFNLPALTTVKKSCVLDQTRNDSLEIVARVDPGKEIPEFDETNNERKIVAP